MPVSASSDSGNTCRSTLVSYLVNLPPEIIVKIFDRLRVRDLLNVRQVCHGFHSLVHQFEQSICEAFSKRLQRQHPAVKLAARVHGMPRDLIYQMDLQYRFKYCWWLACILTDQIIPHLRNAQISEKGVLETMRGKKAPILQSALFPALFALNNFFECMRVVVIQAEEVFADWDDDTYAAVTDVFMLDQQHIIEELCPTSEAIKDLVMVWIILQGVCEAKQLGAGWRAPQYPFATLERILLYKGLPVMYGLLTSSSNDAARCSLLQKVSESLWQVQERQHPQPPLESIHHLATERLSGPARKPSRPTDYVNKFINNQEILLTAAFAVLQRQGEVDDPSWCSDPTSWVAFKIRSAGEGLHDFTMTGWQTSRVRGSNWTMDYPSPPGVE